MCDFTYPAKEVQAMDSLLEDPSIAAMFGSPEVKNYPKFSPEKCKLSDATKTRGSFSDEVFRRSLSDDVWTESMSDEDLDSFGQSNCPSCTNLFWSKTDTNCLN